MRTKKGLLTLIDIIINLGERGIDLRGSWNKADQEEDGNFIHFVNWKVDYDNDLKEHLKNAKDNAMYTSPKIQN